jgi:hypothetical protein
MPSRQGLARIGAACTTTKEFDGALELQQGDVTVDQNTHLLVVRLGRFVRLDNQSCAFHALANVPRLLDELLARLAVLLPSFLRLLIMVQRDFHRAAQD